VRSCCGVCPSRKRTVGRFYARAPAVRGALRTPSTGGRRKVRSGVGLLAQQRAHRVDGVGLGGVLSGR
jgi:hypothetical protein